MIAGEGEDAAAGDGVPVDRGHRRPGEGEEPQEDAGERRQEALEVGVAAVDQAEEVDSDGEGRAAAGEHQRRGVSGLERLERGGERLGHLEVERVHLAVLHVEDRHVAPPLDRQHVPFSPRAPPRRGAPAF